MLRLLRQTQGLRLSSQNLFRNTRARRTCEIHERTARLCSSSATPAASAPPFLCVLGTSVAVFRKSYREHHTICEGDHRELPSLYDPHLVVGARNSKPKEAWVQVLKQKLRRGLRMLFRLIQLSIALAPVAFLYPLFSLLPVDESDPDAYVRDVLLAAGDKTERDVRFVAEMRRWYFKICLACAEQSGAAVVKLLQWAGSRPDLFGREFCSVFSQLQDNTTPHSWKHTDLAMREAYGVNWERKIQLGEILGSGCIGQVYRGTILSDTGTPRDVAVKILHPSVEDGIGADLDLMRFVAYAITKIKGESWLDWNGLVEEFAHLLELQLDLRREAYNLNRFAENFKDWKEIMFPHVISEFSPTKQVLVESFLDGIPVLDYARENRNKEVVLHSLCMTGIKAICKMIFLDNFVHGDLHPGNVFVSRDGSKFILFDVGIVTEYSDEDHRAIVSILREFIKKNGRRAGELMIDETHRRNSQVLDEESFLDKMAALTTRAGRKDEYLMKQLGVYISLICDAAAQHHVRVIPPFISCALAVKVQEGIALALDPSIPIMRVATPIIVQSESKRQLLSSWKNLGQAGYSWPERLSIMKEEFGRGNAP